MNQNIKNAAVDLNKISIKFGSFTAVDEVTLQIGEGEIVGLLGSNGAGKSSTMKTIAGVLKPTSGSIRIGEYDLSKPREAELAKGYTGYCPDVGGLVVGATPREHIQLLLNLHRRQNKYPVALSLVEKLGLQEFVDTPVGGFSHGMQRRLSVLLAAMGSTKVLVLDEPFDGVDPLGVDGINDIVFEAAQNGLGVIISTHLQSLLTNISDRMIVMKKGSVIHEGAPSEFSGEAGVKYYQNLLETH